MKRKHLLILLATLVGGVGLWLARTNPQPEQTQLGQASVDQKTLRPRTNPQVSSNSPADQTGGRPPLQPPNPTRRFTEFTPEQRVEFARKGHGPGG